MIFLKLRQVTYYLVNIDSIVMMVALYLPGNSPYNQIALDGVVI